MSRAFTKEDDGGPELLVVPRPPLPTGVPNYVTPRGLRRLQAEQAALEQERSALDAFEPADRLAQMNALTQRLSELQARLVSAELVDPRAQPHDRVRFGAEVRVRHESGTENIERLAWRH